MHGKPNWRCFGAIRSYVLWQRYEVFYFAKDQKTSCTAHKVWVPGRTSRYCLRTKHWSDTDPVCDAVLPAVCTGSCARNSPINLTSERGLIELSLTSSMLRSSSKSAVRFECQWLIQPSTGHTSVVLQFLSLRLFASGASPPTTSRTKSSCLKSFVGVHVGKNLVSYFLFLFYYYYFFIIVIISAAVVVVAAAAVVAVIIVVVVVIIIKHQRSYITQDVDSETVANQCVRLWKTE